MSVKSFPNADTLLTSGFPKGKLEGDICRWLEEREDRHLVIFSEGDGSFPHERAMVVSPDPEGMRGVARRFLFLRLAFLEGGEELKRKMALIQRREFLLASDYQDRGMGLLENFLHNQGEAKRGTDLFGKFAGIPAVVCGAGPSLEKVADSLQEIGDRALILAGGTALKSLEELGISPHFGGAIDPHPPQARMEISHHVPLFYQQRVHHSFLEGWQGERLCIPGSQHDLFEEEFFDGGWNVSSFLTAIAYALGCNPIILVGVDLSQEGEKVYAGDLPRNEGGELVSVEGTDLFSRVDWLFARDWLSEFAKGHPDREWIQASPGGLDIGGFVRQDLGSIEFREKGIGEVVEKSIAAAREKEPCSWEELLESYERVEKGCIEIVKVAERAFPQPLNKVGEYLLLEVELEKEEAYHKHLLPVWRVWEPIFARQIPKEAPPGYGVELHKWLFMQEIAHGAAKL